MTPTRDAARRNAGLDLLRGLAVTLVMFRHAWPEAFGGAGIVGVTIFFALSGYLITGLLVRDIHRFGAPRWARFYVHRLLRLMPALLLLLAVYGLVETLWSVLGYRGSVATTLLGGVTYTADLPLPLNMGGLTHLWSLAIEEQFYLVWPALLYLAARRRLPLGPVTVVCAVGLTLTCWATLLVANSPNALYARPSTWASSMAIGAVAKLYEGQLRTAVSRGSGALTAVAALTLTGLCLVPDAKDRVSTYLAWPTVIAVCAVILIFRATRWESVSGLVRVGAWIGLISYGAYLWNLLIVQWFETAFNDPSDWATAATLPLTVAAAVASWYTVELAGRRLRTWFDARTVPAGFVDPRATVEST